MTEKKALLTYTQNKTFFFYESIVSNYEYNNPSKDISASMYKILVCDFEGCQTLIFFPPIPHLQGVDLYFCGIPLLIAILIFVSSIC